MSVVYLFVYLLVGWLLATLHCSAVIYFEAYIFGFTLIFPSFLSLVCIGILSYLTTMLSYEWVLGDFNKSS